MMCSFHSKSFFFPVIIHCSRLFLVTCWSWACTDISSRVFSEAAQSFWRKMRPAWEGNTKTDSRAESEILRARSKPIAHFYCVVDWSPTPTKFRDSRTQYIHAWVEGFQRSRSGVSTITSLPSFLRQVSHWVSKGLSEVWISLGDTKRHEWNAEKESIQHSRNHWVLFYALERDLKC